MTEILVIKQIYTAYHTEIFYRQGCDFALFQLVHAGAVRKDGNTEILPHKVFYRCYVVNLKHDIEVIYTHADALEMRNKKISRARVRKAQYHLFLFNVGERDGVLFCERIVVGHDADEIVCIEQTRIYARIVDIPLDYGDVKLIIYQHRDAKKVQTEKVKGKCFYLIKTFMKV